MKILYKIALVLLLSVGSHLQAQYSLYYYHQVGDTVEWKSEIGYYSWWEFKTFFEQNLMMELGHGKDIFGDEDSSAILMRFYTPLPLKIIGVAGLGLRGRNTEYLDNEYYRDRLPYIPDTDGIQEYYYIYDADASGLTLKAQVPWSPFDPGRTLHVKGHNFSEIRTGDVLTDSCCWYHPKDFYTPLHEYYFDSAIYVTDSFYVGYSVFGNRQRDTGYGSILTTYRPAAMVNQVACDPEFQTVQDFFCRLAGVHLKYKNEYQPGSFEQKPWLDWGDLSYIALTAYPIVEVDTTVPPLEACPPVSNIQVLVSGTTATVTWDNFPNYSSVFLSYGPCNVPQNQWETVEVTGNTLHTLTELRESACYKVMMRARCEINKRETPWSTPVTFITTQDTDTVGIGGEPTALSQFTFLAPNPARSEVVVSSSFNLQEIDIWTVDGVWVHHQTAVGHQVTVPIDFLRPGTYIVAIHTHDGTTHKKLLVQ